MISNFSILYLSIVGIAGALLVWWSRNRIVSAESQRRTRVKKLKRFESAKTATPIDQPLQEAQESAVESVEHRFSIIRKISINAATRSKYFANYEDPRFWIMGMEEKGVKCWVAAWADSPIDAWELGNDIRTDLIRQFKQYGIRTHKFQIDCTEKRE